MTMRVHPISLALRYLKGQRRVRGAPYYGGSPFGSEAEAVRVLREFTGEDFGTDAAKWGKWLRQNRRVYYRGGPTRSAPAEAEGTP
jgi:hypothetical protein